MYKAFQQEGYKVVFTNDELNAADPNDRTLGIFSSEYRAVFNELMNLPQAIVSNMAKWVDRNVCRDFCEKKKVTESRVRFSQITLRDTRIVLPVINQTLLINQG